MTDNLIDLSSARAQRQGAEAMATEVRLIIRQYEILDQVAGRGLALVDANSLDLERIARALEPWGRT